MVMPYPSAIATMRFLDVPSIFSVMVARSLGVCFAGRPFMTGILLKGVAFQCTFLYYLFLDIY